MPRTPRNPGSGKAPHNGPSRGKGWGGEAKGMPPRGERNMLAADSNPTGANIVPEDKAERIKVYRQTYWDVMVGEREPSMNKMDAASRLWARDEGLPVAKQEQSGETIIRVMTGVPRADRD